MMPSDISQLTQEALILLAAMLGTDSEAVVLEHDREALRIWLERVVLAAASGLPLDTPTDQMAEAMRLNAVAHSGPAALALSDDHALLAELTSRHETAVFGGIRGGRFTYQFSGSNNSKIVSEGIASRLFTMACQEPLQDYPEDIELTGQLVPCGMCGRTIGHACGCLAALPSKDWSEEARSTPLTSLSEMEKLKERVLSPEVQQLAEEEIARANGDERAPARTLCPRCFQPYGHDEDCPVGKRILGMMEYSHIPPANGEPG